MSLRLYDAHNHLQDERFGGRQAELLAACAQEGVVRMVVNGSCEEDWPRVLALAEPSARDRPGRSTLAGGEPSKPAPLTAPAAAAGGTPALQIIPSFGYHPWYAHERTPDWLRNLVRFLDQVPSGVGEIGLDRWKPDLPYDGQEEVFIAQLRLAAERNRPASIHCLRAWGRMFEILKSEPRPRCGFLLHSYGGPKEMVSPFADLGAYFSLPGYYAREGKERQRETFKQVPPERLLIETDAPDQRLPSMQNAECAMRNQGGGARVYALSEPATGQSLNHPANLRAVYEFAAGLFGESIESFAARVERNFLRLFGGTISTDEGE